MKEENINRKLIKKYPFLRPYSSLNGAEDNEISYCEIKDYIPEGWWNRFGLALCEDLKDVLVRNNCLEDFHILQSKEKYGSLRIYTAGSPEEWHDHMFAWEYISEHTCGKCGAFPVKMRYDGWLWPWCDKCFKEVHPNAAPEAIEKWTEAGESDDSLLEYISIRSYSQEDGEKVKFIDMKPYYKKIKYKSKKYISKEEYLSALIEAEFNDIIESFDSIMKQA